MKNKIGILFTLSMVLGIGVTAITLTNRNIKETEAKVSNVIIYLDVSEQVENNNNHSTLTWDADNAVVKAYYYGGSKPSSSSGVAMTKVMQGIYSLAIPNDMTYLNFYRCSPNDGSIWNRAVQDGGIEDISTSNNYVTNNIYKLTKYDCFTGSLCGYWNGLADVPSEDGYYLVGNDSFLSDIGNTGTSWRYDTGKEMETLLNQEDKARIYDVHLSSGSRFKVRSLLNQNQTWYDPHIALGATGITIDNGEYLINEDGRFNIFINGSGEAWASNTSITNASNFAKTFNSNMATACNDKDKTISTLSTAWSNEVTTASSLDAESLGILKDVTASDEDTDLAAFAEKYDFIYGKYGYDNSWSDFANRNPNELSSSNHISLINNDNNLNALLIISIISSLSLITIGLAFYIKKYKRNK